MEGGTSRGSPVERSHEDALYTENILSPSKIKEDNLVANRCEYSDKYSDDQFEYRHVILPKDVAKGIPIHRLLSDAEWRALGVQQSRGWVHYATHRPEPHILLFRRPLGTDPTTGEINAEQAAQARREFEKIYGLTATAGGDQ